MADLAAEVDVEDRVRAAQATANRLQRQLVAEKDRTAALVDAIFRGARDAAIAIGTAPPSTPPKRDARKGRGESALLHVTDWQIGKSGESYSTEIGRKRIAQVADKTLLLTEIQRRARPIRECHVMLGGDMVEGVQIFSGQPYEIDATLFAQIFEVSTMIERLIRTLAGDFEAVHVWEACGNHGRLGRSGEYPRHDNADAIAYKIAADRFVAQRNVTWHPSRNWYQIVTIGRAYRGLLVHGDQVKGFGGNVPAYGILRKANAWASGVVEPFRDAFFGHFHQWLELSMANGGVAYVTPSTESDNQYAKEFCAATGQPSQRLAFVDGDKGRITSMHRIYLD